MEVQESHAEPAQEPSPAVSEASREPTTTPDIIPAASRKRSSPDESSEPAAEPAAKRQRSTIDENEVTVVSTRVEQDSRLNEDNGEPASESATQRQTSEANGLQTPPPEDVLTAIVDTKPAFDDEPAHLLRRAAAVALQHVGFDGASKEALEELCSEIDAYAAKLLSYVRASMLSARRSQPIPVDFEYALRHEGLTASLLKPHLKTPISTAKLQPVFLPPPPAQEIIHRPVAKLLGKELDGDSDKRTKAYIPKKFPSFPSKHTYKSTEVKSDRETDPRKIREKATEEARHGEEALRRLVKVEKAGDQRVIGKDSAKVSKQGTSHQMWEKTMKELANGKKRTISSGGDERDEEQSIMVNAAKQYGRTTPARKKH